MTLKTGKEDYLGIQIDYDKELNLTEFSLATLKERFLFLKKVIFRYHHLNLKIGNYYSVKYLTIQNHLFQKISY